MKFMRKLCIASMLCLLALNCIHAKTKSFSLQVIQKNGPQIIFDASYLMEQSVLDYFFEYGYIVSNTKMIVQQKNDDISSQLKQSYAEAQEGYLDYQVLMTIIFNTQDSTNPESAMLSNIEKVEWEVISLTDGKKMYKGYMIPPKALKNNDDSIIQYATQLAATIKKAIDLKGGSK
ncbi:MAG: hypothetical protein MJ169_00335 [Treponema sp.]|nr:hypothetical protein [Treponema sp.]